MILGQQVKMLQSKGLIPSETLSFFCPRKYAVPRGYNDPRHWSYWICCNLSDISEDKFYEDYKVALKLFRKYDCPVYFVDETFLSQIENTQISDNFSFEDLKLPMPHFLLVFPERDGKIAFSHITAPRPEDESGADVLWNTSMTMGTTKLEGGWRQTRLTKNGVIVKAVESAESRPIEYKVGISPEEIKRMEAEYQFGNDNRLVLKLLLAISARPLDLVEPANDNPIISPKLWKKTGQVKKDGLWTPRWIGKAYGLRISRQHNLETISTGAKKVMHWRRGHFRRQACGKNHMEHKVIWIEPILVGVKDPA